MPHQMAHTVGRLTRHPEALTIDSEWNTINRVFTVR